MPRKRKDNPEANKRELPGVVGLHGSVEEQSITETLEVNFMPYAMSVIVSRAIPEIDGFKPSHRKLLYTMLSLIHIFRFAVGTLLTFHRKSRILDP